MGKLVRFDKPERLNPDHNGPEKANAAGQVLLFTGVRYERMPDQLPKPGPDPAKRKRKRG